MSKKNILIYGAGSAGEIVKKEISRYSNDRVVSFIDDDYTKKGKKIFDISVDGTSDQIEYIISKKNVDAVYIALPSFQTKKINQTAMKLLKTYPDLEIKILPNITKYFEDNIYKNLENISFNEIFERQEISLNYDEMTEFYQNKTVLITGAGGSIGSEISRQILNFKIKKLICLGRGEDSIYRLKESIENQIKYNVEIKYVLANIKNLFQIKKIISLENPHVVIHAAAHKHVPIVENNPQEGFYNNVIGTYNVLTASKQSKVEKMIYISTDKAVNPINIMGATKRLSELLCSSFRKTKNLDVSCVRFGNVLGSRGSVIPKFIKQIKNGGPVTITDPKMQRYFMSIPEASLLVLNAGALKKHGQMYLLEMGEPYKILDIAQRLIHTYSQNEKIEIIYTGLRPGEKINEKLNYNHEKIIPTKNKDIFELIADEVDIIDKIENLKDTIYQKSDEEIKSILKDLTSYNNESPSDI